jgi:hypothetical protein
MAALTAPRATVQKGVNKAIFDMLDVQLKANVVVYNGALIVLTGGYGKPGVTGVGLIAAGVAQLVPELPSITAGTSDGATTIRVAQGVFKFNNSSAGDLIAQANVGAVCYVVDDNTVALTSGGGTRSIAGTIMEVDSSGVSVSVGMQFAGAQGAGGAVAAGSVEAIVAAGALSVNTAISTLAITGTTAYTLANGLFIGQRKTVVVISGASTPAGTITPATPSGFSTVAGLNVKGQAVTFIWAGAGAWYIESISFTAVTVP